MNMLRDTYLGSGGEKKTPSESHKRDMRDGQEGERQREKDRVRKSRGQAKETFPKMLPCSGLCSALLLSVARSPPTQ